MLFVVERFLPLRLGTRPLLGHLLVNFTISALAFAAAMRLVRPQRFTWASERPLSLVHVMPMPVAVQFIIPDRAPRLRIESSRQLIEEDEFGVIPERERDEKPLLPERTV
jgi:hypothetical protein